MLIGAILQLSSTILLFWKVNADIPARLDVSWIPVSLRLLPREFCQVTYFHVYMESWMGGYVEQWDSIQSSYSSMAPKDLGTMGYVGLSTIYVPKPIRNQAYSTSGRALQYYRDWNHSWNQPWNFFDSLASINTSFLAPCNTSSSVMMNDATMRVVVQWTGDMDGVVINDETGQMIWAIGSTWLYG